MKYHVLSKEHCVRDSYILPEELYAYFCCFLTFNAIDCVEFHELCQALTISLIALAVK